MTFSLIHLSDPHFGEVCDLAQVEAVQALIPDLEPRAIVISGDLTLRARHGEFQAAHLYVKELERTAPVYLIPGNHDVQWWWRFFVPFAGAAKYRKYRRYFGPALAPTMEFPEAIITSALTSHGVAWGSLTSRVRDIAVKGHLPRKEIERVKSIFSKAGPGQLKVLVVHHNVLRGELSRRMGLARWRTAQKRIVQTGADLVLCGHDHQEMTDTLDGRVVVSCTGTLSTRSRGNRPSTFHRIVVDHDAIQVELFRWNPEKKVFRRSDVFAFARHPPAEKKNVAPAVG